MKITSIRVNVHLDIDDPRVADTFKEGFSVVLDDLPGVFTVVLQRVIFVGDEPFVEAVLAQ